MRLIRISSQDKDNNAILGMDVYVQWQFPKWSAPISGPVSGALDVSFSQETYLPTSPTKMLSDSSQNVKSEVKRVSDFLVTSSYNNIAKSIM